MGPGDIVRIKVPPELIGGILYGAPVWDEHPWRGPAIKRWQLPDSDIVLVLEHALRVASDPESGAALILSPASDISGWVMDTYLHDLDVVEAV